MKRLIFLLPMALSAQLATKEMLGKETKAKEATAVAVSRGATQVLLIEPAARAKDLASAFTFIHKANPSAKLSIKLSDGKVITNILSIDPMEGGTLVIFKLNTLHGVKYQVEKIENLDSIVQS